MSTNYYLHTAVCEHCRRPETVLHIGKSSGGWAFALHVRQFDCDEIPSSLSEWKALFVVPGNKIVNEYGKVVSPEEMIETIQDRYWKGPGGLRRHDVDGQFCIARGEGTWDLCVGEFS